MENQMDVCTLVVLEASKCLVAQQLDQDTAITIVALISDDPSSWEEAMSLWPRYRTPAVCECATSLALSEKSRSEVMEHLAVSESWVVIDFENKRVLSGGGFQTIGRSAAFYMVAGNEGHDAFPMSIELPPWWELHEEASLFEVSEPRHKPICRPVVNRDVLYGVPFFSDISNRALDVVASSQWQISDRQTRDYYPLTLSVHRDWLMTKREDLAGKTPRELLHGAMDWSDKVTYAQQQRFKDTEKLIATPCDWNGFATAPMGSQEVCMYFDYCREAIRLAWVWCLDNDVLIATQDRENLIDQLVGFLEQGMEKWLGSPFEDGPSPSLVIEADRRRAPMASGVLIEGIDQRVPESHILDCNCPICLMMADGSMGPSFSQFDGHHLELDDEFAFSMIENYDEWASEHGEFTDEFQDSDSDDFETEEVDSVGNHPTDSFGSAWSGVRRDQPIPGDRQGKLMMAFMVAEIVGILEGRGDPKGDIVRLNEAFVKFRTAEDSKRNRQASKFKKFLESLANRYPELISKSADLQSRIDEAMRALTS